MIAGEAETRDAPASNIAKFEVAAGGENFGQRRAAGVSRAQNAANAGPSNMRNGDVILLQDLQDPEVGEPAGESATECESDTRAMLSYACFSIALSWDTKRHVGKDELRSGVGQWEARPLLEVQKYCRRNRALKRCSNA